ncbi:formate transporter FocA, partial [Rubrivivax gelatinosus]|nr:formate transporter FocA [Rubrivivax gelatinosus]
MLDRTHSRYLPGDGSEPDPAAAAPRSLFDPLAPDAVACAAEEMGVKK